VSARRTIALATSASWPELSPDDAALIPALRDGGFDAEPVIWSDASIDWSRYALVVVRSCWDYHLRVAEFDAWIERVARLTTLVNPPSLLRWNLHKSYLLGLASEGVRIPASQLVRNVVIKPAVSASAYETRYFADDLLVQEFVSEIATAGEWSLLFFDGAFSHAVVKRPRSGDFRVQEELGGSATPAEPSSAMLDYARFVLERAPSMPVYARVDLVERAAGITLMELELIEPSLFLRGDRERTDRFAAALLRQLR